MYTGPTFDDLEAERSAFIGPPAPHALPKMTPPKDRALLRKILDDKLAERIAAETEAASARTSSVKS